MIGTGNTQILTNARVFHEEWVPGDFRYRSGELEAMSAALRPIVHGEEPSNLFCWGPSGAGKTASTTYLLQNLQQESLDVTTLSISCWSTRTRHSVLYNLLTELDAAGSLHPTASSSTELLDRVKRVLPSPAVLVLDEADQLEELDVLYDLYHLDGLALVMLSNADDALFARMDDRLRSRLQHATRVEFDRYSTDELEGILAQRIDAGIRTGAVSETDLRQVADAAVGNARNAIRILAAAARIAESRDHDQLTEEVIASAVPEARSALQQETIDRLDDHQYALYEIIREAGEIDPGEAYDAYVTTVDEPRTQRTIRNYVQKLAHYDLVEIIGENRGRTYRCLGSSDRHLDSTP
jgi:orc1/cdc6 family replication initiation protein